MSAEFTPVFRPYSGQGSFRFWSQKVLPLVYDDSLSYYELLCKVINFLNNVIQDMDSVEANTQALLDAYNELQSYVNTYFDNLDVQEEINHKLDEMAVPGGILETYVSEYLQEYVTQEMVNEATTQEKVDLAVEGKIDDVVAEQLDDVVAPAVTDWLNEYVDPVGSAVVVDSSLSITGAAADAKVTGDNFKRTLIRVAAADVDKDHFPLGTYFIATGSTVASKFNDFPFELSSGGIYAVRSYKSMANANIGFAEIFAGGSLYRCYTNDGGTTWAYRDLKYIPLDDTLTISGDSADAKVTGDKIKSIESTNDVLSDELFNMPRLSTGADGKYTINMGYWAGDVGDTISASSSGTLTAKIVYRAVMTSSGLVSIDNSNTYKMSVKVADSSTRKILSVSGFTTDDVYVNPNISENGVEIGVNFQRIDGSALSESDITALHNTFHINYSATSKMERVLFNNVNITMNMELGTLTTSTYKLNDTETQYADFYKTMRTPHYLDVGKCTTFRVVNYPNVVTAIYYDEDYNYVDKSTITTDTDVTVTKATRYIRFVAKKSDNSAFTFTEDKIKISCNGMAEIVKAVDDTGNSGVITMCYSVYGQIGRDYTNENITNNTPAQISRMVDTTGMLRLPPNYSNKDNPSKMIIYFHGSLDYTGKWSGGLRTEVGHEDVIDFLVNSGYAVFDSYGHSSDAPITDGNGHTYGDVDCMNCYVSGIRRVMNVYNISEEGVYVTGISSGGVGALNLAFGNDIPVLACAPFAPAVSIYSRCLGYNEEQRKEYAWAMGFLGDSDVLNGRNASDQPTDDYTFPVFNQDLFDYFTANADRVIGYNPMWNGVVGTPISTLLSWSLEVYNSTRLGAGERDASNWANVYRVCKTPIKIWIANDDTSVPPSVIYNFLTSLKNGQCIGELRQVPNGQGGHNAYTSSDTTDRRSGITKIGISFTDIPVYWLEMIAFFERF